MRVIVGCEFSQIVTKAFRERGHEAYSCDILPCEGGHPEWHLQEDILEVLKREKFDLGIFHPPCTYLSNAGIGHFNIEKWGEKALLRIDNRFKAMKFFYELYSAPIERVCVENPVGYINGFHLPSQIVEPFYFGDNDRKRTCLWLRKLPKLFYSKTNTLFEPASVIDAPLPVVVHQRKPGKHYEGGELKKRYFTDAGSRDSHIRSKTFPGIANAMADQWSALIKQRNLR